MTIKGLLFDFGGVLVRTGNDTYQRSWEQQLALPSGGLVRAVVDSDLSAEAVLGTISVEQLWQALGARLGLPPERINALREDYNRGDQLDDEIVTFLRMLRGQYKTAIVSNAYSDGRQNIAGRFQLDELVDEIVISAEEGVAKPDARLYDTALARLGLRPEETIFVDDCEENILTARLLGMQAVHFRKTAEAIVRVRDLLAR